MVKLIFLGFPHRGQLSPSPYRSTHPETSDWPVNEVRSISPEAAETLKCHSSDLPTWGKLKGRAGFATPTAAAEKRSKALKAQEEEKAGKNADGSGGQN